MADYKERLGGGVIATYGQVNVPGATSVVAGASAAYRLGLRIQNIGANTLYLAYGGVATSTAGYPVPSQAEYLEPDYLGQIQVAVASGASSTFAFVDARSS